MHRYDLLRYALLDGVALTAGANRRHYRMATTWLPHLLIDSLALLLPDLLRGPLAGAQRGPRAALRALVCENPRYALYVLPLAAGYITSSPRFNIYKGELGELRLAGFGLDAIPHTATAFALTALIGEAAEQAARHCRGDDALARLAAWGEQRPALLAGLALALATLVWEAGEYRIYRHELGRRGSREAINMQWSLEDTLFDCLSNALGWAAAAAWRRRGARAPLGSAIGRT